MSWPTSHDYLYGLNEGVEMFRDPDLTECALERDDEGAPRTYSGSFADVFKLTDSAGRVWAAKCFTRELPNLAISYPEVITHLQRTRPAFALPIDFQPQGIALRGTRYPLVKMAWSDGIRLDVFIAEIVDDGAALDSLFDAWVELELSMRQLKIGHGDLQHNNVLVERTGAGPSDFRLKLIDYDGMAVPGLVGRPSPESGAAAFQHPLRIRQRSYRLDTDQFSHLLIATTLRALAVIGRPLWDKYHRDTNLVFSEPDLQSPARSALCQELWPVRDPLLHFLLAHLLGSAQKSPDAIPSLDELLLSAPDLSEDEELRARALVRGEVPGSRSGLLTIAPAKLPPPRRLPLSEELIETPPPKPGRVGPLNRLLNRLGWH